MANGTVNVRTREDGKLGEMRVDAFAEKVKGEMNKPSGASDRFYQNVWKPENYGGEPKATQASSAPSGKSAG